MKAWVVTDEEYSTVVFAETRSKAKIAAMATDCCEDMEYLQIKPRRFKEADEMYRGNLEMNWDDYFDRRFLCEHGWSCVEIDKEDCEECGAKDVCDKYQDFKNEMEEK